jgi:hypothetical protein
MAPSASSKNAKWWAHQSSEPPCIIPVSTIARAEQRSHRSAAVRCQVGPLSTKAFMSSTLRVRLEISLVQPVVRLIATGTPHRTGSRTNRLRGTAATTTSSRLPGPKYRLRRDSPSEAPAQPFGHLPPVPTGAERGSVRGLSGSRRRARRGDGRGRCSRSHGADLGGSLRQDAGQGQLPQAGGRQWHRSGRSGL